MTFSALLLSTTSLPSVFIFHIFAVLVSAAVLAAGFKTKNISPAWQQTFWVICALNLTILPFFAFWQSSVLFRIILPLIERALSLLALIWICWGFLNSDQAQTSLPTVWGLSLVLFIAAAALMVVWLPESQRISFNESFFNTSWLALCLLLVFAVLPALRKIPRASMVFALLYLCLMGIGVVAEFLLRKPGSFPSVYHYAAGLGLLIAAPGAFISFGQRAKSSPKKKEPAQKSAQEAEISTALASQMLDLGLQQDQSALLDSLTHSLSLYLMADICGVTSRCLPGPYRPLKVFDLIREDTIKAGEIPAELVPGFISADQTDLAFMDNKRHKISKEKEAFLKATNYNQVGNLLYYPISPMQSKRKYGLLCASPYTSKVWGEQELYKLKVLRPKLEMLLEKSEMLGNPGVSTVAQAASINHIESQKAELQEQMQKTNALLANIRADKDRLLEERTQEVRLWSERQRNLENQVDKLNAQLSNRKAALESTRQLEAEKARLEDALARNATHLGQLKEALNAASSALKAMAPTAEAQEGIFHSNEANTTATAPSPLHVQTRQRIESEIRTNANLFARQGQTCLSTVETIPDLDYAQTIRLSRILEQLQRNACSASPNYGQVKIDVLSGEPEGKFETIEICVTDYGGGLSPSDLQHFLKYISCTGYPVPVGIGDAKALKEALDLVKSSGGHLWVNNPEPNATSYRILLPVEGKTRAEKKDYKEGLR
ncbi:MAG: hypothetical protein VB108_08000 [Anaerolineaceae bacterium]|nr:hypothetical protein [Anaerolineaceae bacterium]